MTVVYSFLLSLDTSSNAVPYLVLLTGCNISDIRLQGAACSQWSAMKDHFIEDQRPEPIAFTGGWLRDFKRQYGAQLHVGYGESGSVNLEACRARIEEIKRTLATFALENIYNCDEAGL